MIARPVPALALFALLGVTDAAWTQDASGEPSIPVVTASQDSIFTNAELARARQVAIENEARRESYIRAHDDDDIITLEPASGEPIQIALNLVERANLKFKW